MDIYLYENKADTKQVDKSGSLKNIELTPEGHLVCNLKEDTSVYNPVFEIGGADLKILARMSTTNYCWIPDLGRYYFVNDLVMKPGLIVELHCHCDVLMSNKDAIKTLTCLVDRQENWNICDKTLIDEMFPVYQDKNIEFSAFADPASGGFSKQNAGRNIVLTVTGGT